MFVGSRYIYRSEKFLVTILWEFYISFGYQVFLELADIRWKGRVIYVRYSKILDFKDCFGDHQTRLPKPLYQNELHVQNLQNIYNW